MVDRFLLSILSLDWKAILADECEPVEGFPPVVFVVGTTASGKSAAALRLAERFDGEIINCDSVQVYRHLDIGSAKPPQEERNRVPHHLFDCIDPPQTMTAGDYKRLVDPLLVSNSRLKIVVGGTGFYFQALEKGMFESPKASAETKQYWQARLDREGLASLYKEFQKQDPQAAQTVSENDTYRILRALEVMQTAGQTMTAIREEFAARSRPFPHPLLKVGMRVDREVLRERVTLRAHQMFEKGWVQEVEGLLAQGWQDWPALRSVGYREVLRALKGELHPDDVMSEVITSTMQLAKRQRTWFQRDAAIEWFDLSGQSVSEQSASGESLEDRVRRFLQDRPGTA